LRLALCLFAALFAVPALGQYPSRPIHVIVPVPPGGAPDIAARLICEKLSERLGQPMLVEGRPGSNGIVAANAVAKAAPDGYTLLVAADSHITVNPHIYRSMPLDPVRDLVPVASLAANTFVLAVNAALPVKDFADFVAYARAAKPNLAYASSGIGSQHQLAMELLKRRAGIELLHVPYKGAGPAVTATIAGEVAAMFAGTSVTPQIKSGRLRALATTGARRSAAYPGLPAIAEFYPGYELSIWLGLFAPADTPAAIIEVLRAQVNRALALPDVQETLRRAGGLEPYITTAEEFTDRITRDHERYGRLVKEMGVMVE